MKVQDTDSVLGFNPNGQKAPTKLSRIILTSGFRMPPFDAKDVLHTGSRDYCLQYPIRRGCGQRINARQASDFPGVWRKGCTPHRQSDRCIGTRRSLARVALPLSDGAVFFVSFERPREGVEPHMYSAPAVECVLNPDEFVESETLRRLCQLAHPRNRKQRRHRWGSNRQSPA